MKLDLQRNGAAAEILLQRALRLRFCPLCSILQERIHALLCELQLAALRDPETRAEVLAAHGYCHFHYWYLDRLASPAANAALLESLLTKVLNDYAESPMAGTSVVGTERSPCPVCRLGQLWEDELVEIFAMKLADAGFRAAYADSAGICLPHSAKLSTRLTAADAKTFLRDSGKHQIHALIDDLGRLVQKGRTADHTPGSESDAVSRGIAKLVGKKYFRPS